MMVSMHVNLLYYTTIFIELMKLSRMLPPVPISFVLASVLTQNGRFGIFAGSLCTGCGISVELVLYFGQQCLMVYLATPASLTEPVPRAIEIVRTAVIAG